ncbi:MAG: 23S rRNA (guanosine(2251)-2'-O)-methyltransferase RlmB [Bauldia sp.]|nr:23S rRNA (guanosine(2251)-2'-O)-methyltransferase RlmB [Bauldia sp.]
MAETGERKDWRRKRDRRGVGGRRESAGADGPYWIYGLHAVAAALANPRREIVRMVASKNALDRLVETGATLPASIEEVLPRELDRLLGAEAVHQGVAIETEPLEPAGLASVSGARLLLLLDQVTDPHNVGAVLRSAAALGVDALVTTSRHRAAESGVLAKAASGALDLVPVVEVTNLARAMEELGELGFMRVGLDSEGPATLEDSVAGDKVALVLGAEGKGLRHLTRELCDVLARIDMPGAIKSLNVSNAAVLALYIVRRHLDGKGKR